MRIVKPGEPCPCCGTPVREDLPKRALLALSYIAEGRALLEVLGALEERVELPAPSQEPEGEPEEKKIGVLGPRANEKREIMERLRAYREAHGLGCWAAVAKASGGRLREEQLRIMHAGTAVMPITEWRLAARALDRVENGDG